jgi:RNA polymerase II-associated factor 1
MSAPQSRNDNSKKKTMDSNNNNNNAKQKPQTSATNAQPSTPVSEFICKFKYLNTLPDIPFDPKFLNYPFDDLRFAKYVTTSLEKNYKYQLHTESDMGIPIDLIEPNAYKPLGINVDILGDGVSVDSALNTQKRRFETLRPNVPWLRRTEYMAADSELPKFRSDKIETKYASVACE